VTLSVGDILVNRYRIVKLAGQGGFGAAGDAWGPPRGMAG